MPSPSTALTIIEDALGLSNAVGMDQTLSADEATDCLRKFNDLIESWSTQRLAVYGQAPQTFVTVASQAAYTIGPGGDWNTVRPERISGPGYTTITGISYPCVALGPEDYASITAKTLEGAFPNYYSYMNEHPLGIVTLWPVPNAVLSITLAIDRVLTQAATAATIVSFPPGYVDAFVNVLAVRLAPIFGKQAAPHVMEAARESFGAIKRANKQPRLLSYGDAALL